MGPISGWPAALSSSAAESCVRAGHPERAVWQRSGRGHGRLLSAGRVLHARNCGGRRLTGSRCLQCLPERNPEPSLKSRRRNVVAGRATIASAREQIGRAHVWTPVTNAHLVCSLLLEKKQKKHSIHN